MFLSSEFYPAFFVDLKQWYMTEYGDYLFAEKPYFFIGVVGLKLHRQHLWDPLLQALVQHHLLDLQHLHRHFNDDCVGGADGIGEGV
ncbi:hypothetical protein Dsin_001025 [Dipteronia sinensis]|uniref:Uncharacterized protein n=1 Tax=Dipteronia sinensis TaxID=43782 RepID=A0AAE0B4R9_9ROSI|nr:hypothetical protein Dsin_001025 [Dipteronia sinensis]